MQADPELVTLVAERGFAARKGRELGVPEAEGPLADAWHALAQSWDDLVTDTYMPDGGTYRLRRFGRFSFAPEPGTLVPLPEAPVVQDRAFNRFAGGLVRHFAPLLRSTFENAFLHRLIDLDFRCFAGATAYATDHPWTVLIHQVRIRAEPRNSGRPTPEGIHRDNHDFIAMHLVRRDNVAGGESGIYGDEDRCLYSCVLEEPLDTLYVEDDRVKHGVADITSADGVHPAVRDMLIIDFDDPARTRVGGYMGR